MAWPGDRLRTDPTIEVVHVALGFATAAVHGDHVLGHDLARHGLGLDAEAFIDALLTTIEAITDEADESGADIAAHLREIGLGLHLAALEEELDHDHAPRPTHP